MGIIAAAIVAASMSSLDSSFNSLATISTVDFYEKYFKKGESPEHYLTVSRGFTVFWAIVIIVPAIIYSAFEGSVLQTLARSAPTSSAPNSACTVLVSSRSKRPRKVCWSASRLDS